MIRLAAIFALCASVACADIVLRGGSVVLSSSGAINAPNSNYFLPVDAPVLIWSAATQNSFPWGGRDAASGETHVVLWERSYTDHTGLARYVWVYSTDMTNWTFAGTNVMRGSLAPPRANSTLQTVAYYNEPSFELDQWCCVSGDRRARTDSNTLGAVTATGCTPTNLIVHGMAEYGGNLYMAAVTAGAHASRSVGLYRWSGVTGLVAVATGIVTWARDGIISEPALTFAGSTCIIVTASAYTSVVETAMLSTSVDPFTSWTSTALSINLNGAQMTTDSQGRVWMVGRHQDIRGSPMTQPCVTALWRVYPSERMVKLRAIMETAWQRGDDISKCGYGFPVVVGDNVWCIYYSGYKVYTARVDATGEQ